MLNKKTLQQVSGVDPKGKPILSVLAKQTLLIRHDGSLTLSSTQEPLAQEPVSHPDYPKMLLADTDLFPYKRITDVIIKGHIYEFDGRKKINAIASINGYEKLIKAIGKRKCKLNSYNKIVFSSPEIIEKIPLNYLHAFGGRDLNFEEKYGVAEETLNKAFSSEVEGGSITSPFIYPRNPCGKGYLIEKSKRSVNTLQLPNLEDPKHLLTPENLAAQNPLNWHRMPLPQATDWLNYSWFPRVALFGLTPPLFKRENEVLTEIERGYLPEDIFVSKIPSPEYVIKVASGASLGLQIPHLTGGEPIKLTHMHPEHSEWKFNLPSKTPRIWTDGRNGKLNKTSPVIHTLTIEPDKNKITIVWRGSAEALRAYHHDELENMPFKVVFN